MHAYESGNSGDDQFQRERPVRSIFEMIFKFFRSIKPDWASLGRTVDRGEAGGPCRQPLPQEDRLVDPVCRVNRGPLTIALLFAGSILPVLNNPG